MSAPTRAGAGCALVMEGGGYRGLFTEGAFDLWMEEGVAFDEAVGVSAGAAFGCNLKSRQPRRALAYNMRFCGDPRYAGWKSWIATGDFFNREFAYGEVPWRYFPFDSDAFARNPMRFTLVATDLDTGGAVYHCIERGDEEDVEWIRASASIPVLSRPVELDGLRLLDGGVADSIPVEWMLRRAPERTVVVLTQPRGFVKRRNPMMPLIRLWYRRHPAFVAVMARRHEEYNRVRRLLEEKERTGEVFCLYPSASVAVPVSNKDPRALEAVYERGRQDALAQLDALKRYLGM